MTKNDYTTSAVDAVLSEKPNDFKEIVFDSLMAKAQHAIDSTRAEVAVDLFGGSSNEDF